MAAESRAAELAPARAAAQPPQAAAQPPPVIEARARDQRAGVATPSSPPAASRRASPRASPRTRASRVVSPTSIPEDSRAPEGAREFDRIRSLDASNASVRSSIPAEGVHTSLTLGMSRMMTGRTMGMWMVTASTLEENRSLVRAAPELQGGKRATLVGMLFAGGLVMAGAVELFVRCVLDPALQPVQDPMADTAMIGRAVPTLPEPRWGFTGSGLTDGLSSLAFAELQCLLTCFVCVVTGLGTEFFVGYELLTSAREITPWHEHAWFVAQFLFSITCMTALQLARAGNALAFVFMIAGVWKFGFPETLLFLVKGYGSKGSHWTDRLTGFMNAFGTLAHHSCALLAICILALGLSPLTRPYVCISMPLVFQHVVVGVKYYSLPLYALLELLLEIWWECEVLANIERFYLPHGVPVGVLSISPTYTGLIERALCGMLLAHWLYWASAILDGVFFVLRPLRSRERYSDDVESGQKKRTWHGHEVAEWRDQFATYDANGPPAPGNLAAA